MQSILKNSELDFYNDSNSKCYLTNHKCIEMYILIGLNCNSLIVTTHKGRIMEFNIFIDKD